MCLAKLSLLGVWVFISHIGDLQADERKYNLSVCAFIKNESHYLREWIEYHRLVGVDHFYLYDNASQDKSSILLAPYIKQGVVTRIYWPDRIKQDEEQLEHWMLSTKLHAYEHAAKYRALNETRWLVILDVDEYLVPVEGNRMDEVLQKYDNDVAVTLKCDFFDASVIDVLPRRELLIETVELTGPPAQNIQRAVDKMIFKPEQYTIFTWPPYRCHFKDDALPVPLTRQQMRINKYVNRFNGSWHFSKRKERLHVDNRLLTEYQSEEVLRNGFVMEDKERTILRFEPQLRKSMGLSSGRRWELE